MKRFIEILLYSAIVIVAFNGCGSSVSDIKDDIEDGIEDNIAPPISEDAKKIAIPIIKEGDI